MDFEVIYYTKTKNTKKIAEVIAQELGVKAENIREKRVLSKDSIIILGSGIYVGKIGKDMVNFIERNDFRERRVALFETSGEGAGKGTSMMEKMLKEKGAKIVGEFHCKGKSMYLFNREHPNDEEIARAREFARKLK